MPARTGQEYITGLKERPREVWLNGERIKDVTTHPALCNGVESVAALYDMQHDPSLREEMTFASPSTGDPVGLSFMIPKTVDDLVRRREMMTRWAWASCGMMGAFPRLHELDIFGMGRVCRLLRPGPARVQEEHGQLPRVHSGE